MNMQEDDDLAVENFFDRLTTSEKLSNRGFLEWLRNQYQREIEILSGKLEKSQGCNGNGAKNDRRRARLNYLRNRCLPFVTAQLQ